MIVPFLAVSSALAAPPLTADDAVARALPLSSVLAEAHADSTRALGQVRASCGLRQDPTLRARTAAVGELWALSLSQPVSVTGEGMAACTSARRSLEATEARALRAELEVAAQTRRLWVDAVVSEGHEVLATRSLEVAQGIEDAALQRQTVGESSLLDLRLARLQVEQARTAWMMAAVDAGEARARLSAQVGEELLGFTLPADPLGGVPQPAPPATRSRSDLAAARAEVDAAEAGLSSARAGTLAPVQVGAFAEQEGDEFRAGPMVSLSLPLWRGNADGRADALARLAEAEVTREEVERRADAQRGASRRTSGLLEEALRDQAEDLPAEASAALDSVALGYERGELDLLSAGLFQTEILEGHRAWLESRRVVAGARIDLMLADEDPRLVGGVDP